MDGRDTTVSVIIPTYNRGRLLAATIDSVLAQSHPPLEVLVCDDASTDSTADVVAGYTDPRVRWIEAPCNSGFAAAPRNRGICAARGEWLAFLDHDDLWEADKLARQLRLLADLGCYASSTDAWRSGPGLAPVRIVNRPSGRLGFADVFACNYVVVSSAMIHRSIVDRVGFFPEAGVQLYQDYAMWLRVCCVTDFALVGDPLVLYWDDPATGMRRQRTSEAVRQLQVLHDFAGWLRSAEPAGAAAIGEMVQDRIKFFAAQLRLEDNVPRS